MNFIQLKKYKLSSPNSLENLVFCTKNGSFLLDSNIRRTHINVCKKATIRQISFHGLRHTFATRMIENGIDVKTVSELLGHSSIEITLNTYVHSTDETKRAAANIQDIFFNNLMSAN